MPALRVFLIEGSTPDAASHCHSAKQSDTNELRFVSVQTNSTGVTNTTTTTKFEVNMVEKAARTPGSGKPVDRKIVGTVSLRCETLSVPEVSQATGSLVVAIVASLCFAGSLSGDFVFDDSEAILNNEDVRMETNLFSVFKHDFWGENITSSTSHKSYRPLTILTFRLNYWTAGGYDTFGFHLVNLVLHAFNSMLSLRVFSAIFGGISVSKQGKKAFTSPKASLLAALLFAVHPIHTENVSD